MEPIGLSVGLVLLEGEYSRKNRCTAIQKDGEGERTVTRGVRGRKRGSK